MDRQEIRNGFVGSFCQDLAVLVHWRKHVALNRFGGKCVLIVHQFRILIPAESHSVFWLHLLNATIVL